MAVTTTPSAPKLELVFQEITDPWIRENFKRIADFINANSPLKDFKFFEIDVPSTQANLPIKHGLPYVPLDTIVLSAIGNNKFFFLNQFFDAQNIYVTTFGPVRIRFLLGRFTDPGYEKPPTNYAFVAPDVDAT